MTHPYGREKRIQTMRDVIRFLSDKCVLKIENAPAFARTYGVMPCEVEAEMMKYLSEGDAK
jgi:hypothetical protein